MNANLKTFLAIFFFIWGVVGIVLAAFLAFLRRDRFLVVLFAWIPAMLALILGVVQTVVLVVPPESSTVVRPWPGPATLMLGFAFIAAASIAAHTPVTVALR